MISLQYPWLLLLLPLPWLIWRYRKPYQVRVGALRLPFFEQITARAGLDVRPGALVVTRHRIQTATALIVWGLLVFSLARPERVGDPVELSSPGRDLLLAVDISGSMENADFLDADGEPVERLAAVKTVVGDFIDRREGDRVALIVFGSKPFLQAPFTEDLAAVRELLELTRPGMAGPHTVLGDAIGLGITQFERSQVDQRLMILLSDGADTGSRMSPANAAEIAARNDIRIYTVGVGDPQGNKEDDQVDLAELRNIASRTGGEFFMANDIQGLATIYERIDALSPRKVAAQTYRPRYPLGYILLGAAAVLIVGTQFYLLGLTRRRSHA